MKIKKIYIIGLAVLIFLAGVLAIRLLSGDEDTWLCDNGQWVKHGMPSAPAPTGKCGTPTTTPRATPLRTVELYYYNPNNDKDTYGNILCSSQGLVPVTRQIPVTMTPIQDTIKLLLQGNLTSQEKAQGITTEYPLAGLSLTTASLKDGVLTLTFADPQNKTGGGSCRVGILWAQINATAKQFPEVKSVKFMPEELFQP